MSSASMTALAALAALAPGRECVCCGSLSFLESGYVQSAYSTYLCVLCYSILIII